MSDVLIGDEKVRVETQENAFDFERIGNKEVVYNGQEDIPEIVRKLLSEKNFTINDYPKTITRYIHNDPTAREKDEICKELNVKRGSKPFCSVVGFMQEIKLDIRVEKDGSAHLEKINDTELESDIVI